MLRWGSATHCGRVRSLNEDALLAGPRIFAVADGMGGHAGGDVASAIAISALAELEDNCDEEGVRAVLSVANARIRARAEQRQVASMGTTMVGVIPGSDTALVFNVGDSRAYRLRDGDLVQLTEDHSLVAELVAAGELTAAEANTDRRRNVVTRALGVESTVDPAVETVDARPGDVFLLCSDGLYTELSDGEILSLCQASGPVEKQATALCRAAVAAGGHDNVSVVLVQTEATESLQNHLSADTNPQATATGPRPSGVHEQ